MVECHLSGHPRRRHAMGTRRTEGGSAPESQGGGSRGLHESVVPGTAACDEPDAEVAKRDHEPTPNPSQEGNFRGTDDCLLPSWEGSGVGFKVQSSRFDVQCWTLNAFPLLGGARGGLAARKWEQAFDFEGRAGW